MEPKPSSRKLFSIIIVTWRRFSYLKKCLEEISFQLKGRDDGEILILINGEDKETENSLKNFPSLRVFKNSSLTPGEARNILITKASGTYVFCLDDDASPSEGYFNKVFEFIHRHPEVDVFGGPEIIFKDASLFEQTVGMALSSPMATYVTRWRHREKKEKSIEKGDESRLILCNLWFRREIFQTFSFDSRFFRNEENVLLWQLQKAGKIIKYLPYLFVYHRKKKNIPLLMKAVLGSGKYRMKSFLLFPGSSSFVYMIPMCFVFYLVSLFFVDSILYRIPLVLYAFLSLFFSIHTTWRWGKVLHFPYVFFTQILINIGYGMAFWPELFSPGNWQRYFVREEGKKGSVLSCQYNKY